jgi:hypothetical protein
MLETVLRTAGFWSICLAAPFPIPQSSPDYQRASYTLLGASLELTAGAWEFSVYAKNIPDDRKFIRKSCR